MLRLGNEVRILAGTIQIGRGTLRAWISIAPHVADGASRPRIIGNTSGFSASQVAKHVRRQTSASRQNYGPRQAAYDLKKFRGKEHGPLVGKSRRYEPTPKGLRMISGLIVLRERVLEPLTRSNINLAATSLQPIRRPWTSIIEHPGRNA